MTNGGTLQLAVTKPTLELTHVTVSVFHQKAGRNVLTGAIEAGGIYVAATPVKMTGNSAAAMLGQGYKELVQASDRLNRAALAKAYEDACLGAVERSGTGWDQVSKVCDALGVVIAK